jgi:hypothetical protein
LRADSTAGVNCRSFSFHGRTRAFHRARQAAFTLMETLFAVALVSVLFVTIYGAINSSVSLVRTCQDNERVTQILSEKLDTIRLYNWIQLTDGNYVPTNFIVAMDPLSTNSMRYCTGTISIASAPVHPRYKSDLLEVVVKVDWMSGSRPQSRSMTTCVAKYGLQTYIMR